MLRPNPNGDIAATTSSETEAYADASGAKKDSPAPRTGSKRRFAWSQEDTSRNNRAKTAPATQKALAKG
jgi:hypothetical protein